MEPRALQIDHRIPYQIIGDDPNAVELNTEDFMLLSGTSNRAKSWSCEHCTNWKKLHKAEICKSCYWAYPENYTHVAMNLIRRLDLTWEGEEVNDFELLKRQSDKLNEPLPEYVKSILKKHIK